MRRLALLTLLLCSVSAPALSGTLYRCTGGSGETVYSSTRTGFTGCRAVSSYTPDPVAPAAPASPAANGQATTGTAQVEFRTAPGEASPPAPQGAGQARTTRGAVYRYEKDGVVHYTNRRPAGQAAKVLFSYIESCFACGARSAVDWHGVALNTAAYAGEIAAAAAEHGVDEALVRAVIHAESAFRQNAVSRVGAQGLMQLMPATASRFGVTDAFAADENIRGGTTYLAWLMKRYKGDIRRAVAAYNAGEGAVDRYAGIPPYDETQRYVERVGILHERYRGALAAAVAPTSPVTAGSP